MKRSLPILVILVLGLIIGWSTAVVRLAATPWNGSPEGEGKDERMPEAPEAGELPPQLVVEEQEYDFGTLNIGAEASHDFVFSNRGKGTLRLAAGNTSCKCTVGEIGHESVPAGESTNVTLTWTAKGELGPYRHTATIFTNDPNRRRMALAVSGRLTVAARTVPAELVFHDIPAGEPAVAEAVVYAYLDEPLEIVDFQLSNAKTAEYFDVDFSMPPLSAEQLAKEPEARSGRTLKVTVKPGLPLGRFRQTIQLRTDLDPAREVEIPVMGTVVSDISVYGDRWDETYGLLTIGTVASEKGAEAHLTVIVRGPHRQDVKFEVAEVFPDFLEVEAGERLSTGAVKLIPVTIRIPAGSPQANHVGSDQGRVGRVLINTNHPKVPQLRMLVRFAVKG